MSLAPYVPPTTDWEENRAFTDAFKTYNQAGVTYNNANFNYNGYDPSLALPKTTDWTEA